MIGRNDERGLGHISREFFRHVNPSRSLIVEPTETRHDQHRDWYDRNSPEQRIAFVRWEPGGELPERETRGWIDGLEVLYAPETFYDHRILDWAADAGVATILHANPEFCTDRYRQEGRPTMVWNQSPWRPDLLRGDARTVPVPVATDRFSPQPTNRDKPLRVLHLVGAGASNDRNGTAAAVAALKRVTAPVEATMLSQVHVRQAGGWRTVTPRGDYWDLYSGYDVLVMPRRYAGQSLPVQEAMAAGLAVIMPDCEPNGWWPVTLVPAMVAQQVETPGGTVDVHDVCPGLLAQRIEEFARDRDLLADAQAASLAWAEMNSWGMMLPLYETLFDRAVRMVREPSGRRV